MVSPRKTGKRMSRGRDFQETSSTTFSNRSLRSLYSKGLASPPASSGPFMPSSSLKEPDLSTNDINNTKSESGLFQPIAHIDEEPIVTTASSNANIPPSSPQSHTTRQPALGSGTSSNPKRLLPSEKVKLLKISCKHGSRLLHCPTSGRHADKEVWTSIMEEFAVTVRAGVFSNYAEVKKTNNKICRSRRKRTFGTISPQRRSCMGNLDTWIDRWVRVWNCRDLVVNTANLHQSIRETFGEKELKRIFRHRIDSNELPQELGVLTFSAPLWKKTQKRFRAVERSVRSRRWSLFPNEVESECTDGDEMEDDTTVEVADEEPPLQSIEQDYQTTPYPVASEDLDLAPDCEIERELGPPGTSPITLARLNRFEETIAAGLKEARKTMAGKQVSVLDLARKKSEQDRLSPLASSSASQGVLENGTMRSLLQRAGLESVEGGHGEDHSDCSASGRLNLPGLGQVPHDEAAILYETGTSYARSHRLEPGTYCPRRSIPVGWHIRQIPLAGINDTAEQDFRQSVFASFANNGQIHFRLRNSNMRGDPVPPEFRLNGTISVSHRDIMYRPPFNGMHYDEMRMELARESFDAAKRRITYPWMPTTVRDPSITDSEPRSVSGPGDGILDGVDAARNIKDMQMKTSMEESKQNEVVPSAFQGHDLHISTNELELQSRISVDTISLDSPIAGRGDPTLSKLSQGQPFVGASRTVSNDHPNPPAQESRTEHSNRRGTPGISKKLFVDEARKQKPPVPPKIPHHSTSVKKPNTKTKRPSKNRITPSRFYGNQTSDYSVEGSQQLTQQQGSGLWVSGTSHRPFITSSGRSKVQEAGSSQVISPRPFAQVASILYEDSDGESLPEVEELHRRFMNAAKNHDNSSTLPQHPGECQGHGSTSDNIQHEESNIEKSSHLGSDHVSPRIDAQLERPEDVRLLGEPSTKPPEVETTSGSQSKNCMSRFMVDSSLHPWNDLDNDSLEHIGSSVLAKPTPSASYNQGIKRGMPPSIFELVSRSEPGLKARSNNLKLGRHPTVGSGFPSRGVSYNEPGRSSGGDLAGKSKGKAVQRHIQDRYPTPREFSTTGDNISGASKRKKGHGRNTTSYYSPYGLTRPSQPREGPNHYPQASNRNPPLARHGNMRIPSTSMALRKQQRSKVTQKRRPWVDRRDQKSNNNNTRFLREATTDTVDYGNFSPKRKINYLHHKVLQLGELYGLKIPHTGDPA